MKNNFDILRLLFAICVVITHSYILSGSPNDFFWHITNNQTSLSYIGVAGFFIISGYLISKSYHSSKSLGDFFEKRIRRIFPGIIVAQLVTLIAISLFIKNDIGLLFNKETISFFIKGCTIFFQDFNLHGVFENNPYPKVINGSLWTIPYELLLYIGMGLLFWIFKNKKNTLSIITLGALIVFDFLFYKKEILNGSLSENLVYLIKNMAHFSVFFFSGVIYAQFENSLDLEKDDYKKICIGSLCVTILILMGGHWSSLHQIVLPILVLSAGSMYWEVGNRIVKTIGDCSYGVYIYSFPVQQVIMNLYPNFGPIQLMVVSLPTSILLGILSWRYVEKNFLKRTLAKRS